MDDGRRGDIVELFELLASVDEDTGFVWQDEDGIEIKL